MVVFPNAKINIGLNIIQKRADGFHDLETVFYPINKKDALEAIRSEEFKFSTSGITINGDPAENLCIKAFRFLQSDFPAITNMEVHLHKAIPMGAGLGGGSANGAFMLLMLSDLFNLALTTDQLIQYALKLGSDCPFFVLNKPVFATGRGELMKPVELDLSTYQIVIVNPAIHLSTAAAFVALTPMLPVKSCNEIVQQPVHTWKDELVNDFEKAVFSVYPQIGQIKEDLYAAGAVYASMSGSGSTVYGIFPQGELTLPTFNENYHVYFV